MTLQELIDWLNELQPISARTARVVIGLNDVDIVDIVYDCGEVTFVLDGDDPKITDPEPP